MTPRPIAALLLALLAAPVAAQPLTLREVAAALEMEDEHRDQVLAGEIATWDYDERSDKEMSIVIAMKVPLPLSEVIASMRENRSLDMDRDLIASGVIEADGSGLENAEFTQAEGAEIDALLKVKPGDKFNLSTDEIAVFQALAATYKGVRCSRDPSCRDAVNGAYRLILADRVAAYRSRGLAGIAPYDRGKGKTSSPQEELLLAAEKAPLAQRRVPEIYNAWLNYPLDQPEEAEHIFLWLKRNVENRPTFTLSHRAIYPTENAVLWAERHFFAGQFYNSIQMAAFVQTVEEGTFALLLSRTSTDLVAGFGSSAKKKIGRGRVRKDMVANFERVLAALE